MALLTIQGYKYITTNLGIFKAPVFVSDVNPDTLGFYPQYAVGDFDGSSTGTCIRGGNTTNIGVQNLTSNFFELRYQNNTDYWLYTNQGSGSFGVVRTGTVNYVNSTLGFIIAPNGNKYFCVISTSNYASNPLTTYTIGQEANISQLGFIVFSIRSTSGQGTGYVQIGFPIAISNNIYDELPDEVPTDPYNNAGDSTTGGGGGTFDGTSDPVPIPSLPTVGATDTGFISLFVPSLSQINSVASYLWSNFFDIDTFKKLFEDPMDCILGLSVVPVSVPTSGSAQLTVGNIELSGISLPLASNQYVEINCGSIAFTDRYFGSYLDFEPYTKISIFLPYCGVHQLNADDIMGKTIQVVYHVDILTGSCVAFVKCGDSVLYQFNGACATNIPITNISYNSTIENAIRIAVNIGTTVATAGASAPLTGAVEGASVGMQTAQNVGRGISLAGSTAEGALSMKPSIGRSGALGGTTGIMAGQTPYLIITRPRLCKPKNQDFFMGYPSFIQTTIGDLIGKGFTSFTEVIISSQYLTDDEESELENILKGGVYL